MDDDVRKEHTFRSDLWLSTLSDVGAESKGKGF